MLRISLYFDFVSPYSWLGLERALRIDPEVEADWRLHPVVYAKLLDETGLVGPAESEAKRCHLLWDVARQAAGLGLPFVGPPAHPFRSLEALRLMMVLRNHPRALELAAILARAAWTEGRDLTQIGVLEDVVGRSGLDPAPWVDRISMPETKRSLAESTAAALERGIFGVPTFEWEGELFWGQDRLDDLLARYRGELNVDAAAVAAMLARPRGADRRSISPR